MSFAFKRKKKKDAAYDAAEAESRLIRESIRERLCASAGVPKVPGGVGGLRYMGSIGK